MDIFDVLTFVGGLCLFLFGMNVMGQALERSAGNKLQITLGKLTSNRVAGLMTGMGVTSVIQSSSATTVMVVGFVNSGLMTLRQAINVIMGANIGTTITAWILSLGGISGDSLFVQLLKPTSFSPVLALIGIVLYMFAKTNRRKDIGMILLGFATLMFGMNTMSSAVSGLKSVPEFTRLFVAFENPILGVLAGAVLTAIIQSSSASVGILQAFAMTGSITYSAAIPIIMGQNIGTCVTAILSSFGTNKNAKRAALIHLNFNVIGTVIWLIVFTVVNRLVEIPLFGEPATMAGIAVAHSVFNIACTLLLLPMSGLLEKLAMKLVPESKKTEILAELDERLLQTPAVALDRCRSIIVEMARLGQSAYLDATNCLDDYDDALIAGVTDMEDKTDHYEDIMGTYLVKLSANQLTEKQSVQSTVMLKLIGDFERICDHALNITESASEIMQKQIVFSDAAKTEMARMREAVGEIVDLTVKAYLGDSVALARDVEPLEEVIDVLKENMRTSHILRLKKGECSIEAGFVWADLLTNLERISDHCSNIAGCIIEAERYDVSLHESLSATKSDSPYYKQRYAEYAEKYLVKA